jgi:hypothetical protein
MESNKNILCSLLVKRVNKERGRQIKTIEKVWIVYLERGAVVPLLYKQICICPEDHVGNTFPHFLHIKNFQKCEGLKPKTRNARAIYIQDW